MNKINTLEDVLNELNMWYDSVKNTEEYSSDWYSAWRACINSTKKLLEPLRSLATQTVSIPPVFYPIGTILRRSSDGLKVMIVKQLNGCVTLIQQNNGKPFGKLGFVPENSEYITPKELVALSGGYTFLTEAEGRDMNLHWAKGSSNGHQATPREFSGGYSRF